MAGIALDPAYRRVSVHEFLAMDLGDAKAELVDGLIFMMAGGSPRHAGIAANLTIALGNKLRGSGYRPYGSDLAVRTGEGSIRFPDVSVYCRDQPDPEPADPKLLGIPRLVFEVLSPSTASNDQITKLAEYLALPGLEGVVFVDPDTERMRLVTGGERDAGWLPAGSELDLPMLGLRLTPDEVFSDA